MNLLSKQAEHIIQLAKQVAREYGQGYVGTEHLLLAIVREGEGLGAKVLAELDATEAKLTEHIHKLLKARLHQTWVMGRLPGTPHFKDVVSQAAREARGTANWQIQSEHLLLALLHERDSIGYQALKGLGLSADAIRKVLVSQRSSTT